MSEKKQTAPRVELGQYLTRDFSAINRDRCIHTFGHKLDAWTPLEWGGAVAGEVGELCNLLKKLRRGEDILKSQLADEIGDIIAYLDLLASTLGLSIDEAVVRKFNQVSEEAEQGKRFIIDKALSPRARN